MRLMSVMMLLALMWAGCNDEEPTPTEVLVSSLSVRGEFIEDGGSSQMSVIVTPEDATNQKVDWSVSNQEVATIDETGVLTAVTNGIVTVTATATDGSAVTATKSIRVSGVQGPIVLVESISLSVEDITDGREKQFSVEVLPANATNKDVEWLVSDESIAEIS